MNRLKVNKIYLPFLIGSVALLLASCDSEPLDNALKQISELQVERDTLKTKLDAARTQEQQARTAVLKGKEQLRQVQLNLADANADVYGLTTRLAQLKAERDTLQKEQVASANKLREAQEQRAFDTSRLERQIRRLKQARASTYWAVNEQQQPAAEYRAASQETSASPSASSPVSQELKQANSEITALRHQVHEVREQRLFDVGRLERQACLSRRI